MQFITKMPFLGQPQMPFTKNYTEADKTAGNTVAIQPMLGDFSEEIIVVSIIAAEKGQKSLEKVHSVPGYYGIYGYFQNIHIACIQPYRLFPYSLRDTTLICSLLIQKSAIVWIRYHRKKMLFLDKHNVPRILFHFRMSENQCILLLKALLGFCYDSFSLKHFNFWLTSLFAVIA